MLGRANEECPYLVLRNEVDCIKRLGGRSMWSVELVGGINDPGFAEGDRSLDFMPQHWTPGEGP